MMTVQCTCMYINHCGCGLIKIASFFVAQQSDFAQAEKYADSAIQDDHYNPHGNVIIIN